MIEPVVRDTETVDESNEPDWFTNEAFWRTFGPLMFGPDQFTEAEAQVADLFELLGVHRSDASGLSVLDLGAGPGRHSLPLARSGCRVTAVDTSQFLLDQLATAAQDEQLKVELVRQDMRVFDRPDAFDLALCLWTSFGYFNAEDDHRQVLNNILSSLKSGGQLVLDLVGLEYLCRSLEPVHLTETDDGRTLVERPVLTDDLTRLENEWLLIEASDADTPRVHRTVFSHRVWSAGEIRLSLERVGFERVQIFADWTGSDYTLEAERQIVVARRPG
ncbi:MAG: class I SAM-dependent methyltransferase [Pseudomonadota bacterium]